MWIPCYLLGSVRPLRFSMRLPMASSGIYLRSRGIRHLAHYLDDFIVIGPPRSSECADALATLDDVCSRLGIPLAQHKRDGPTTCLTFLGVEVDTEAAELRLPQAKLERLRSLLEDWGDRKVCRRRELESLVGVYTQPRLQSGTLRSGLPAPHVGSPQRESPPPTPPSDQVVPLRPDVVEVVCRRVSYLPPSSNLPRLRMASDVSGSWGCGAWYLTHWFQLQWNTQSAALPIMAKELLPVVLACAVWGQSWSGCRVTVLCDNQAVVACLRSRTCHDHHIMHMLRTLAFIEASHSFALSPQYISTTDNHLADDLSRNCLSSFLSKVPDADRRETSLPGLLVEHHLHGTVIPPHVETGAGGH